MNKSFALAASVLLLSSAGTAFAAGGMQSKAGPARPLVSQDFAPPLYDQNDSDSGNGINSQNFEAIYDAYDNMGADDFTVPAGVTWKLTGIDVAGVYYGGIGPAASQHVVIYSNKKNKPGAVVADFDNVAGADNGTGSFSIALPKAVKLQPGKYWVSVQVNMDFDIGGQWAWSNRSVVNGKPSLWQNPGDGFGSGCVKWADEATCTASGVGDKMFTLKGKSSPL
jgi:hypothetical protein